MTAPRMKWPGLPRTGERPRSGSNTCCHVSVPPALLHGAALHGESALCVCVHPIQLRHGTAVSMPHLVPITQAVLPPSSLPLPALLPQLPAHLFPSPSCSLLGTQTQVQLSGWRDRAFTPPLTLRSERRWKRSLL